MQQSNTWLLIAILALLGWTFDALRMFLAMHDTLSAGLGAFAEHFWYALPMLTAVIALNRLRPRARLLGLRAYDDAGQLVHEQGEIHLDEPIVRGTLSSFDADSTEGLQSLSMPSGARVYFLRQSGVTLVASFTGAVTRQELAANIRAITSADLTHFDFVHDLDPSVAVLARQLLISPLKRKALMYFWQRKMMSTEIADLVYWMQSDEAKLKEVLNEFVSHGFIQSQSYEQTTFYRLTNDPSTLERLEGLFAWIETWQLALRQLKQKVA